jgi:hypothetical protein
MQQNPLPRLPRAYQRYLSSWSSGITRELSVLLEWNFWAHEKELNFWMMKSKPAVIWFISNMRSWWRDSWNIRDTCMTAGCRMAQRPRFPRDGRIYPSIQHPEEPRSFSLGRIRWREIPPRRGFNLIYICQRLGGVIPRRDEIYGTTQPGQFISGEPRRRSSRTGSGVNPPAGL